MSAARNDLALILASAGPATLAVSGGVDSMTLGVLAHRQIGTAARMVHAVSPAVPPAATARVRQWAQAEGWNLHVIDAGEFADERYRANPLNRCFFCKSNLYGAIASRFAGTVFSGANVDDLGEYRPGLDAARENNVRHPYLEAGINKSRVRALARELGLGDLADLPASPCLSSRVETLIPIDPETLAAIDAVECLVAKTISPRTVRCRVRASGVVLELDAETLSNLSSPERREVEASVRHLLPEALRARPIHFAAYRNGSAFVGAPT